MLFKKMSCYACGKSLSREEVRKIKEVMNNVKIC